MKDEQQEKRIWQELKKYGIESEEDLDREIKKLKPLNIGIMTSPVRSRAANE